MTLSAPCWRCTPNPYSLYSKHCTYVTRIHTTSPIVKPDHDLDMYIYSYWIDFNTANKVDDVMAILTVPTNKAEIHLCCFISSWQSSDWEITWNVLANQLTTPLEWNHDNNLYTYLLQNVVMNFLHCIFYTAWQMVAVT